MIGYCIDVGSVANSHFGWARADLGSPDWRPTTGTDMGLLVDHLVSDVGRFKVALGFECPLFVPLRDTPRKLATARAGEGGRSWSASAGACSLATGVVQVLWVLDQLRRRVEYHPPVCLGWAEFAETETGVLLWEAFVSERAKATGGADSPHEADALIGLRAFMEALPDPESVNAVKEDCVHSLIGAALLRTGWATDIGVLTQPCLVIRPTLT